MLTCDCLREPASLARIAPEWLALWQADPCATVFTHPEWLLSWWDHFGTDAPRLSLVRDDDGELLGLLPCYDLGAERKTLPLGVGLSDFCDALIHPRAPADTAIRLLDTLRTSPYRIDIPELPAWARLRQAVLPGATLSPGSATAALESGCELAAGKRRKLRQARHRAERSGGLRMTDSAETFADDLDALLTWHEARWSIADGRALAFFGDAFRRLKQAGLARLFVARIGGARAAAVMAFRDRTRLMLYCGAFDPRFAAESPGVSLVAFALATARAEGCAELNFLRGEEEYKFGWGASIAHNATLSITQ